MDYIEPLTDEEFKQLQDWFRKELGERNKNRPPAQGEYQWDGGYAWHAAFGLYQPLYHRNKRIGGMFAADSRWPNEYHAFDEHGGVYPERSSPPVPHLPFKK